MEKQTGEMNKQNRKALEGFVFFFAAKCLLIFLPAWTIYYWQAWVYLACFFITTGAITIYLTQKDPALLARRLSVGAEAEREKIQKIIQFMTQFAFIAIYLVSALDYRFGWSAVPLFFNLAGDVLVVGGLCVVFLVFKENSFTSAIIEVGEGQKVVSTGPYAVVRHPMYSGALIMLSGVPAALGSWWGLIAVLLLMLGIIWRLVEEEKFLNKNLPGYTDYTTKVRWRLVPGLF